MKKNLFILGLAAAVMTSCSTSETLEDPGAAQQQAIGFSSYVSNTTRAEAPVVDLQALKNNGGFYVHGEYKKTGDANPTLVFDGDQYSHVTYTGDATSGSWGYAPINYWVKDVTYKFAAFAPALPEGAAHSFDYDTNSLTIANFVSDGKTDLLVAATVETGLEANTYIGSKDPVKFSFLHALSKVKISFKNGWRNNVTLKISEIKLSGVKTKGTLVTPSSMVSTKLREDSWQAAALTADEPAPVSLRDGDYVDDAGNGDGTKQYEEIYPFENFMIPQQLVKDAIELTFRVTVSNDYGSGPNLDGNGNNTMLLTTKLPVGNLGGGKSAPTQWLPGNAYNYTITISGSTFGLNPITFEVEEYSGFGTSADADTEWDVKQTPSGN